MAKPYYEFYDKVKIMHDNMVFNLEGLSVMSSSFERNVQLTFVLSNEKTELDTQLEFFNMSLDTGFLIPNIWIKYKGEKIKLTGCLISKFSIENLLHSRKTICNIDFIVANAEVIGG